MSIDYTHTQLTAINSTMSINYRISISTIINYMDTITTPRQSHTQRRTHCHAITFLVRVAGSNEVFSTIQVASLLPHSLTENMIMITVMIMI